MKQSKGFTLAEVMFAVLILGIGLIAVASVFPAGTKVRKNTVDDNMSEQFASVLVKTIPARKIPATAVDDPGASTAAYIVTKGLVGGETELERLWIVEQDRTFPAQSYSDPKKTLYGPRFASQRKDGDHSLFVFIFRRTDGVLPQLQEAPNASSLENGQWYVNKTTGTIGQKKAGDTFPVIHAGNSTLRIDKIPRALH